jgi:DNA polymerase
MLRVLLEQLAAALSELKNEGKTSVAVSRQTLEKLQTLASQRATASERAAAVPAPVVALVAEAAPVVLDKAADGGRWRQVAMGAMPPSAATAATFPPPPVLPAIPAALPDAAARLAWLRDLLLADSVCQQHKHPGKQLVFGTGAPGAQILFCGEAPGADEENAGEPFVGPAGQLLTKIIGAMGLRREQVYITNILKWRPEHDAPTGNRPPTAAEMAYCLPYLYIQLEIIRPQVIVALGNTAISGLLGENPARKVGQIHGRWHTFRDIPLMPTYHPSYLLRNDTNRSKRIMWEDLLLVMQKTNLPISDRQQRYFL